MIGTPDRRPGEPDCMAADLADLAQTLAGLCEQLEGRLHALEPYRALQQLAARQASGLPVEAMASAELRSHLERELSGTRDYRVLRLLRSLDSELNGVRPADAVAPVPEPAPVAVLVTPVIDQAMLATARETLPPLEPIDVVTATEAAEMVTASEVVIRVPQWQSDDLHSEASQAVASMFGGIAPAEPAAQELPIVPEPAAEPVPPPPASVVVAPELPPLPLMPVHELPNHADIVEAEASVMASLAKLREARDEALRAAAAKAAAPAFPLPSLSMEGTMANVAAAVAATVAAAGRIAEPKPTALPVSRPAAAAAPSPLATTWRERAPAAVVSSATEVTEIRFVERPASPMLDVAPRLKPSPLANVTVAPVVTQRPVVVGEHAARDWEEAVVEIRRAGPALAPPPTSPTAGPAALPARAGVAFGRFVKSLKGEKA